MIREQRFANCLFTCPETSVAKVRLSSDLSIHWRGHRGHLRVEPCRLPVEGRTAGSAGNPAFGAVEANCRVGWN